MPVTSAYDDEETCRDLKGRLHKLKLSMQKECGELERARQRMRGVGGVLRSRAVLGLLTFVGVVAVLYALDPPITQRARRNRYDLERQDLGKVLLVAAIATVPVLLVPPFRFKGGDAAT